ncbi:MAG: tetratricopeptide repeat protein, partial [Akkermansiaceae bacterium]|nr:tetratricopeptide repeat protein [Armatimonadota bacterium]
NGLESSSTAARLPWLVQAVETYRGPLLPRFDHGWVEPARRGAAERFLQATEQLTAQLGQTGEHDRAVTYARRAVEMNARSEDAHCLLLRVLVRANRLPEMRQRYRELERMLEDNYGSVPSAATRLFEDAARRGEGGTTILPAARSQQTGSDTVSGKTSPPSGTVTFLATDIEGSTALLHRVGNAAYETVRERHHALLRQEFQTHGGYEFKEVGDGFWVAFENPREALHCAIACQRALATEPWSDATGRIAVRMAVHVAAVEEKEGDYRGLGVHEASRQMSAAHGGQILLSEAATILLRRERLSDIEFKDLGMFRLRDAPAPEHLFQAIYPGMPTREFADPNAPHPCMPNIPVPMTRFVGREAEQERLAQLLLEPGTRLVTLTGMGGAGKTRLVIEVARRLVGHFAGAAWFVPLADLSDARRIAENILTGLCIPPSPDEEAMDNVVRRLSAQPSLLVLDNFEQLVEDGALLVHELLERVPTLTCLVTSRQLLGISAEREFEVLCLPTPKAGIREAEQVGGNVSVQLFVDRAQRRRPDFQLTRSNAAAIAELCERLEGVPLSIELAAAWVKMLAPAQLLTQLKNILRSNERDVPERHRSLNAVMDGSYRLLSLEQQKNFARLSVFRGGWTVEAAAEICEDPSALYSLAQLRDSSLILAEENETDGTRYRMLETLREYAEERLGEQQQEEAARRRHHDFFVRLAHTADTELKGEDQAAWCRKLDAEFPNLQTAMAYSDDHGRLQVASDLQRYWIIHGHLNEGRELLEGVLSRGGDAIPAALYARAVNTAGVLAWSAGDFAVARVHLDTGLQLCRETGNRRGTALALNNRANLASQQGNFVDAQKYYEESLSLWKEMGEIAPIAITLSNLGGVVSEQGDHESAQGYLMESLRAQESLGDHFLRANTLQNIGDIKMECGDFPASVMYLSECLKIRLNLYDMKGAAMVVRILASVFYSTKNLAESVVLFAITESLLTSSQVTLLPSQVTKDEKVLSSIFDMLSWDAYNDAWSHGSNMPLDQLEKYVTMITTSSKLNSTVPSLLESTARKGDRT